jgi:hypothetical protein
MDTKSLQSHSYISSNCICLSFTEGGQGMREVSMTCSVNALLCTAIKNNTSLLYTQFD